MNPVIDPFTHKLVNGPEAGQNTEVDGFEVSFIGSTDGTVYNAGSGLTLTGNVFAADVAAVGFGMELAGGTASLARYRAVESVTGSSVTMQAGHAYKIYATSAAITLNTETIPANSFGLEGHLEIFVSGTGYVVTGTNVVLANALEPDAVNNCTVRFHDGIAIISVEDHVAGYIVVSATGTTAGTLPYALGSTSQEYVAFDASLNGQTLDMAGAVTNGEKHVVGNGYADTILTGGVSCTSKTTFSNLAMSGAYVTGGTMTLGDAYIPSGSTVAVSGGGLAIEKVTGAGSESVIDLGLSFVSIPNGATATASGVTITGGSGNQVISAFLNSLATFTNCVFSGLGGRIEKGNKANIIMSGCSVIDNKLSDALITGPLTAFRESGAIVMTDCYVSGNNGRYAVNALQCLSGGVANLTGGNTFESEQNIAFNNGGGSVTMTGSNHFLASCFGIGGGSGSVTLTSGAILDLTGNTNPVPINPGGGITFESGGATVKVGNSPASSSYMIDNVTLPAGAKLTNTAVVNLGGSNVVINPGSTATASGCVFTSGTSTAFITSGINANAHLDNCVFSSNTGVNGAAVHAFNENDVYLTGCTFTNNTVLNEGGALLGVLNGNYGGKLHLSNCVVSSNTMVANLAINVSYNSSWLEMEGCTVEGIIRIMNNTPGRTSAVFKGSNSFAGLYDGGESTNCKVIISSGASITLGSSITNSGGIVVDSGCTVNGTAITGGTYTKINSDGTTE